MAGTQVLYHPYVYLASLHVTYGELFTGSDLQCGFRLLWTRCHATFNFTLNRFRNCVPETSFRVSKAACFVSQSARSL